MGRPFSTPIEVFQEYIALKHHFRGTYDYGRFHGKINNLKKRYAQEKEKIYFEKLARHPDPHGVLLSNFSVDDSKFIRDICLDDQCHDIYISWVKRQQSLKYSFRKELENLKPNFDDNFIIKGNEHPYAMTAFLGDEISLDTLVILTWLTGCISHWDKMMTRDPFWPSIKLKIEKYRIFLEINLEEYREIVIQAFTDH